MKVTDEMLAEVISREKTSIDLGYAERPILSICRELRAARRMRDISLDTEYKNRASVQWAIDLRGALAVYDRIRNGEL